MSESENKRVMDKIRKCLALAESSNEYEAAAAMRQARTLMKKYDLSADSINVFKIKEETLSTTYSCPPRWFEMLGMVVARAFGCSLFTGYRRFIFVGPNAAAEVAGYSFDVLHRQLAQSKKAFLNGKSVERASPATKRKMGQAFCEGWIHGVSQIVNGFASKLSDSQAHMHTDYLKTLSGTDIGDAREKKSAIGNDEASSYAASLGYKTGEKVKLHEGVPAGEQPLRLNQSTEVA